MQCGCSRSRFASLIFSEIRYANISKTDVGELRGRALLGRLGLIVDLINENTHPLIAAPVSIYSAAIVSRRLLFDTIGTSLDCPASHNAALSECINGMSKQRESPWMYLWAMNDE